VHTLSGLFVAVVALQCLEIRLNLIFQRIFLRAFTLFTFRKPPLPHQKYGLRTKIKNKKLSRGCPNKQQKLPRGKKSLNVSHHLREFACHANAAPRSIFHLKSKPRSFATQSAIKWRVKKARKTRLMRCNLVKHLPA
jgi:hypothetical protein